MTTATAPAPTVRPAPASKPKPAPAKGPSPLTLALREAAALLLAPTPKRKTGQSPAEYYATARARLDRLAACEQVIRSAPRDASRECPDGETRHSGGLADYWFGVSVDSKTRRADLKTEAEKHKA